MSVRTIGRFTGAKREACRRAGDAPSWKVRAATAAVAACFAGSAYPNPTGPAVVSGSATIQSQGNVLSITNSPNAIINWQSFSIGANEVTRFIQQNASSAVLNRVIGQDPSAILGALQSNGRVFLINPNGIAFGPNAMIDVAGLVASTLNMADADFLSGRLRFQQTLGASGINNQGSIVTPAGGQVYLIAPNIENSGLIKSPQGEIILAAGQSVELVDVGTPDLRVQITAPDNQAINLGQIVADSGRIGVYAGLIRHAGTASADTVVVGDKGQIIFKATKDIALDPGSKVSASGAPGGAHDGGEVRIIADGTLNMRQGSEVRVDGGADGGNGGFLELSGRQRIALNGEYTGRALKDGYRGGTLLLDPIDIVICDSPLSCVGSSIGAAPVFLGNGAGTVSGGNVSVSAADPGSSGDTLYLHPNMANGSWTNVLLEASNDILIKSRILDSDVPLGGALTLIAGRDITVGANIGYSFDSPPSFSRFNHDLTLSAGRNINVQNVIGMGANRLVLAANTAGGGGDVIMDASVGSPYIDTLGPIEIMGRDLRLTGAGLSDARIFTTGDVTATMTGNVNLTGGLCGDGCGDAGIEGGNVTITAANVSVQGGTPASFGAGAPAYIGASQNLKVTASGTVAVAAGTASGSGFSSSAANATMTGALGVDISAAGVTVDGGTASGGFYGGAQADASMASAGGTVTLNVGSAGVKVRGGTAAGGSGTGSGSGAGFASARAYIRAGVDVKINTSSTAADAVSIQSGTVTGSGDASARIESVVPTTVYLDFPNVASGGYAVNGAVGAITNGSSGFFAGGAPAVLGSTLLVTYALVAPPPPPPSGGGDPLSQISNGQNSQYNQFVNDTNNSTNFMPGDGGSGGGGDGNGSNQGQVCS